MMIKQTLLETSARKFMPKLFTSVSDSQLQRVREYIKAYTQHPFKDTATGHVLDDAASSRGKMIRPRLVLMAGSFGTDRPEVKERLYKLAAVVEMTHLASLIHDDIVDDAPFRRGQPSVQSKYGKNAAVYAGDFLMSRIMYQLMREGLNQAGVVLSQTVAEMCAGEIGQSLCRYKEDVSVEEYLKNIHGKTVALFRACCHLGALESGCEEGISRMLESLGEDMGYMFQMRDDLLDFTDTSLIGKKAHQDFSEGIYTLPVILARMQPGGEKALYPYMEKSAAGTLNAADIRRMEETVADLGGMARAWQVIHDYQHRAEEIIKELPQTDVSRELGRIVKKLGAV